MILKLNIQSEKPITIQLSETLSQFYLHINMTTSLEEFNGESSSVTEQQTRQTLKETFPYKNQDHFNLKFNSRPYDKQFNNIYYSRLQALRPRVSHNAVKKWGKETIKDRKVVKKEKVLEIQMDEPCWVTGTIYCEMKYKPNILKEVSDGIANAPDVKTYADSDLDELYLEDESGRVQLTGELLKNTILVTGVVMGVLGVQLTPGVLSVVDIVYAFPSAQKPSREAKGKIALVSGLEFNGLEDYRYDLLLEYLTGELSGEICQEQISKVVVLGNSVNITEDEDGANESTDNKIKYGAKNKSNFSINSMQQLDQFVASLLTSIPVELLPGDTDPAEISLPQQPLHPSFFQLSKQYISETGPLRNLTNPSWLQYDNLRLLAISGQNINDIYKYQNSESCTSPTSRIDMIESTLIWQNIIPTAPDTLFCYPYQDSDPFCLAEMPHVYLVGNQPHFDQKTLHFEDRGVDVKCIAVPGFKKSGEIILLDLDTLETELIRVC